MYVCDAWDQTIDNWKLIKTMCYYVFQRKLISVKRQSENCPIFYYLFLSNLRDSIIK